MALQVWKNLTIARPEIFSSLFIVDSLQEWLVAWPKKQGPEITVKVWQLLPYAAIWITWKSRNDKVFRNREVSRERIIREVKATVCKRSGFVKKGLQIKSMRAVVQRVTSASVEVEGHIVSEIGPGLVVLVGIHESDVESDVDYMYPFYLSF
ncbi:D-Tyr-tRNA(Tyr) deacylase family protein [Thalictrum thalictroides]|uniref:D-aminoacyl-tRNA deacylase n=1 Tax=Thalictrum thalictroides TaxID=46969 RepID=A0A7J6W569_THATH|nr:D-Tyr-tRNA(Tyr) deacylase family protein [Thalictrum thalictroides]